MIRNQSSILNTLNFSHFRNTKKNQKDEITHRLLGPYQELKNEDELNIKLSHSSTKEKISTIFSINPKYWFDKNPFSTPLHEAIKRNSIKSIHEILDNCSDKFDTVNAQNKEGETPLFIAIRNLNLDAVVLLIEAGAKVNIKNHKNETSSTIARDIFLRSRNAFDVKSQIHKILSSAHQKEIDLLKNRVY